MQRSEIEVLDSDFFDDDSPTPEELGFTIDLAREDLDDDDLGLKELYEHPEVVLGSPRRAA